MEVEWKREQRNITADVRERLQKNTRFALSEVKGPATCAPARTVGPRLHKCRPVLLPGRDRHSSPPFVCVSEGMPLIAGSPSLSFWFFLVTLAVSASVPSSPSPGEMKCQPPVREASEYADAKPDQLYSLFKSRNVT